MMFYAIRKFEMPIRFLRANQKGAAMKQIFNFLKTTAIARPFRTAAGAACLCAASNFGPLG